MPIIKILESSSFESPSNDKINLVDEEDYKEYAETMLGHFTLITMLILAIFIF